MKHILLLGATGTAGSAMTEKIVSDTDYHVTLFARHAGAGRCILRHIGRSPAATLMRGKAIHKNLIGGSYYSNQSTWQIRENSLFDMLRYSIESEELKAGVDVMNDIEKICKIARLFSLAEGENKTEIPFLSIYRSTGRKIDMPQLGSFYIYVVLDGSIRLYTPSGITDYLAGQYSVSKIDTSNSGYVLTFSDQGGFSCPCD